MSVNRRLALILYGLVREFMPRHAVEMGSSVGISGSYQATALRHAGAGRLLVLEGTPDLAAVASETHAELGLDVEIDGHHDGRATVEYFEQILPTLGTRCLCSTTSAGPKDERGLADDRERRASQLCRRRTALRARVHGTAQT